MKRCAGAARSSASSRPIEGRSSRCSSTSFSARPSASSLGVDRLDEARLAHAARAPEQHVVGRQAAGELRRVGEQRVARPVDADEKAKLDPRDHARPAPAGRGRCARRRPRRRRSRAAGAGAGASRSSASAIRVRAARSASARRARVARASSVRLRPRRHRPRPKALGAQLRLALPLDPARPG